MSSTSSRPAVGTQIQVYWIVDKQYYPGKIWGFNEDGKARVEYEDRDVELLNLDEEI